MPGTYWASNPEPHMPPIQTSSELDIYILLTKMHAKRERVPVRQKLLAELAEPYRALLEIGDDIRRFARNHSGGSDELDRSFARTRGATLAAYDLLTLALRAEMERLPEADAEKMQKVYGNTLEWLKDSAANYDPIPDRVLVILPR